MDNPDHYGLFSANVKKFKSVGSSSTQFIGLCPFHEDSKESFTMTTETGLCNCFSCGYKANAYKFAKDIGPFDSLVELREQIVENLQRESEEAADQQVRANVLKQMSGRAQFEIPEVLVKKETDRRVEELARRLIQQQVDPMKANINWEEFREQQHEPAIEAVRSALVLDEIARRENLTVDDTDIDREVARYAERAGRTPAALRARLEKEGGLHRLQTSVRREKAVDFLLSRTTIATA